MYDLIICYFQLRHSHSVTWQLQLEIFELNVFWEREALVEYMPLGCLEDHLHGICISTIQVVLSLL